jgi:hypothetical protein
MNLLGTFKMAVTDKSRESEHIGKHLDRFQRRSLEDAARVKDFIAKNPEHRNSEIVRIEMDRAEQKRIRILQNIPAFNGLNHDQLRTAADSLEEVNYIKGDIIIEQDTIGDTVRVFYSILFFLYHFNLYFVFPRSISSSSLKTVWY